MKLYRKKLTSIEELKHEQIRLRYERKNTKSKHLLPNIGKVGKKLTGGKASSDGAGNILNLAMGILSGGSPIQTVVSLAGPALNLLFKGNTAPKRIAARLIKDLVITYLAGKALQLAIKGGKAYLRSRKAKSASAKLALN